MGRILVTVVLAVLALAGYTHGSDKNCPNTDQSSPRALLETMQKASEMLDCDTAVACMEPAYQRLVKNMLDNNKKVETGLQSLAATAESTFGQGAADAIRRELRGFWGDTFLSDALENGKVNWSKVKITENGDTATFEVGFHPPSTLKKINGKWYIAAKDQPDGLTEYADRMAKRATALSDLDYRVKAGALTRKGFDEQFQMVLQGQLPAGATSAPSDDAGQDLSEGGVQFNSKLALEIWVCDGRGVKSMIGVTPSPKPVAIPKCRWWVVRPSAGTPLIDVVAEGNRAGFVGLMLERASDGDIAQVAEWPKLQRLLLWGFTSITDAGIARLKSLKELRTLSVSRCKVDDAGLIYLKDMTALQELNIDSDPPFTDDGLANLRDLVEMRELMLGSKITDAGLVNLKGMTKLQCLILGTGITDAGLVHLKHLVGLHRLDLRSTRITDAGLSNLKDMRELKELALDHTGITSVGLKYLKDLTTLQELDLSWTSISDDGLVYLKDLKALRELHLATHGISDKGLVHLSGLKALQTLDLAGPLITDAGLVHLKNLTGLRKLTIFASKITDAGFAELRTALPNAKIAPF